MKVNILVPTRKGGKFAGDYLHSSVTGEAQSGPGSPEDELITSIDESKMSTEKIVASRFLTFLANRNLTIGDLSKLTPTEQSRIKKEFKED